MRRNRTPMFIAIVASMALAAIVAACSPDQILPQPSQIVAPGSVDYELVLDGSVVDSGGGPVEFDVFKPAGLVGVVDADGCSTFACSAIWEGTFETQPGFVGIEGIWSTGFGWTWGCGGQILGCPSANAVVGPTTTPDGAYSFDPADYPTQKATVINGTDGCAGPGVVFPTKYGDLDQDPSYTVRLDVVVCSPELAAVFTNAYNRFP